MSNLLRHIQKDLNKSLLEQSGLKSTFSSPPIIQIECSERRSSIVLEGVVPTWNDVVSSGHRAAGKGYKGVVNKLTVLNQATEEIRMPSLNDNFLDGKEFDVLVIGGGIIGSAIARELSKWSISILLIDKEADLAMHASSRNDGMVHSGIESKPGTKKALYNVLGNKMYDKVASELDVPLRRGGSVLVFDSSWIRALLPLFKRRASENKVEQVQYLSFKELREREPWITSAVSGGLYLPTAACISPYKTTIAYAENAVANGAVASLNTVALKMESEHGKIIKVVTNRGTVFPKLVVNAAGVFADVVANMADDQFFTIHPRKGHLAFLDKKKAFLINSIIAKMDLSTVKSNTKGGGLARTVDNTIIAGPDAIEQPFREDFSTDKKRFNAMLQKHLLLVPGLYPSDVISYCSGVRASTYEEDFIIERSLNVKNLIYAAGIQSPGVASAPAIAVEIERLAVTLLSESISVKPNSKWNPKRKGIPDLSSMDEHARNQLIKAKPAYGQIVCRCEEVSLGEVIDAINSPIPVRTTDGIKRRVKTGMGRCQGAYCLHSVVKALGDELDAGILDVTKSGHSSFLLLEETKKAVSLLSALEKNDMRCSSRGKADAQFDTPLLKLPENSSVQNSSKIEERYVDNAENRSALVAGEIDEVFENEPITKAISLPKADHYDVAVLGAGPAGLSAALSANQHQAKTVLIEREKRPGGILKQCIHDGFGLIMFKERLTGPEYAHRYVSMVKSQGIAMLTSTFAVRIKSCEEGYSFTLVSPDRGLYTITSRTLVLATGCRERSPRQISIHGTRPSGILTAGSAQYFVNVLGYLPCKSCIVLGSGDVGMIMARRLTLEGAKVLGVYEVKPTPSGLSRNIAQCLNDYSIPLNLSSTVTRVFGKDRVDGVEICKVDAALIPIKGSETLLECDGLILSAGLIPENEAAESLGIALDRATGGPFVDQNLMTRMPGVYSCGNSAHVNDLVDHVSESGSLAGRSAALYSASCKQNRKIPFQYSSKDFIYIVPQEIDLDSSNRRVILDFRSRNVEARVNVQVRYGNSLLFAKNYAVLRPPEMERLELDFSGIDFSPNESLTMELLRI